MAVRNGRLHNNRRVFLKTRQLFPAVSSDLSGDFLAGDNACHPEPVQTARDLTTEA